MIEYKMYAVKSPSNSCLDCLKDQRLAKLKVLDFVPLNQQITMLLFLGLLNQVVIVFVFLFTFLELVNLVAIVVVFLFIT